MRKENNMASEYVMLLIISLKAVYVGSIQELIQIDNSWVSLNGDYVM